MDSNFVLEEETPGMDRKKALELFAHVYQWIDRLDLWSGKKPSQHSLFTGYVPKCIIDWNDAVSLNNLLHDILQYLSSGNYLKKFAGPVPTDVLACFKADLVHYDWLDTTILELMLACAFSSNITSLSRFNRLTSRQRLLINELSILLNEIDIPSELFGQNRSQQLSAYIYTALVGRFPGRYGDKFAERLIGSLTRIHQGYGESDVYNLIKQYLILPRSSRLVLSVKLEQKLRPDIEFLATVGDPVIGLLDQISFHKNSLRNGVFINAIQAGVYLLLRAVDDLCLPALVDEAGILSHAENPLGLLLISVFLRITGAIDQDVVIAPELRLFSESMEDFSVASLQSRWKLVSEKDHLRYQTALIRTLMNQQFVFGSDMYVYLYRQDEENILLAGDKYGQQWPLAKVLSNDEDMTLALDVFVANWSAYKGSAPSTIVMSEALFANCKGVTINTFVVRGENNTIDHSTSQNYRNGMKSLDDAFQSLQCGRLGFAQADLTVMLTAIALVKSWARWLPRFADFRFSYLLENFILRGGIVSFGKNTISVKMDPKPFDDVIKLAGYLDRIESLTWMNRRSVNFHINDHMPQ